MGKPGRPSRRESAAKDEETTLRRAEVSKLRRDGMTWHTIAGRVGVSYSQARRDFAEYIESLDPPHDREMRRTDIREMLEQALQQARVDASVARRGDGVRSLELVDKLERRALSIMDQIRKLDGLDAPAKVDVTSGGEALGSHTVLDRLAALLEVTDG